MKRFTVLMVVLSVITLSLGFLPVHGEEKIYENVLRFHVLANSDAEEDQALKLKVRDAVIALCSPRLAACSTRQEAAMVIDSMREDIRIEAERVIALSGYSYGVTVDIGQEEYPERTYGSLCFPSGQYMSVQVKIGQAEGQNWWCVLFPPLCLGAATLRSQKQNEDAFIAAGFTPDQYKIITESDKPTYRVRFKILETIEGWFR